MAKIRVDYNIKYIDYAIVDPRPGGGSWRTIVCFGSEEEAREAAKVLQERLKLHNPAIIVHRNKVIIRKYIMEWKIYWSLGKPW